jgi:hypothetical protein
LRRSVAGIVCRLEEMVRTVLGHEG